MLRSEWGAVLKIANDCADNQPRAVSEADLQNILEILFKMIVNDRHPRVIMPDLVVYKHSHASPFGIRRRGTYSASQNLAQQFASSGAIDHEAAANQIQVRRLPSKYRSTSKRADDFVVAHINHPNVTVFPRAVSGDWQDHV